MKTISINELRGLNVNSFSVKDDSPRGITTKYVCDVKAGDKVVLDNHFVLVKE